jgi:hypothetical protein
LGRRPRFANETQKAQIYGGLAHGCQEIGRYRVGLIASVGRAKVSAALEAQKPFVECKEFKHVAEGRIFRAPVPWYFGPRPHYLTNETQKERIASILAGSQVVTALLLPALVLVVFLGTPSVLPIIVPNRNDRFPLMLTLLLLFGLLIIFLQNIYNCYALRSSLRLLPRAAEKITLADRLRPEAAYPLLVSFIFVLVLFVIVDGIHSTLTESVYWSVSVVAGVLIEVYLAAVLWVKLRDRFSG